MGSGSRNNLLKSGENKDSSGEEMNQRKNNIINAAGVVPHI